MKNLLLKLFAFTLLAGFFYACNESLVEEQPVDDLELKSAQNGLQTYIVVLNDAELDAELSNLEGYEKRKAAAFKAASNLLNRAGIVDGQINHAYGTAIKGFSVTIPPGQLKKLENNPSVKLIEKNQVFTLIEPKDIKIYEAEAQYADKRPWGIKRVGGGVSAYDGAGVAWIIDTGIDLDHPDLNVDESRGYSAFIRGPDKSLDDGNGHGTHVAGIVAAKIDAGVVGVAPGATVIPVKVLGSRASGSYDNIIAGVDYVASNGSAGDVANMSLGGQVSDVLDAAVLEASEKGIKFTLSAGNQSTDANTHSPARVNGTNIYTISAMDSTNNFAHFSNYGNPPIDFCQPGSSIYSTYKDGQYAIMSGTSMAAPHMAGILLWGDPGIDGNVSGDPDGDPDPIGVVGGTSTETGTLSGIVTYETTGSAISGATITVGSLSKTTGTDGSYTINNVPVGTDYSVTASAEGYTSETATGVVISEGQTTIKDFSLSEAVIETYTVSGTVTDGSSVLEGVLVEIQKLGLQETNSIGAYSFANVEVGDYTITASLTGYESSSKSISLVEDLIVNFSLKEISGGEAPTIGDVVLTDTGNPAWKKVSVDWTVNDNDGDLLSVKSELYDPDEIFVESATSSVSGSTASGIHELGKKRGTSGTYKVVITVTDNAGNSTPGTYYKELK